MEYNDTNIEVKKIKDYNYSDETKLIFTDVDTGDTIGYIIFTEECFSDNYDERFDGQEVCEIVDDFLPMSIDYLEVLDTYKGGGFGKFIMQYTIDNYIQDNPCILLKCAFNVNANDKDIANRNLIDFYEQFGFKCIPNSNYMFKK